MFKGDACEADSLVGNNSQADVYLVILYLIMIFYPKDY